MAERTQIEVDKQTRKRFKAWKANYDLTYGEAIELLMLAYERSRWFLKQLERPAYDESPEIIARYPEQETEESIDVRLSIFSSVFESPNISPEEILQAGRNIERTQLNTRIADNDRDHIELDEDKEEIEKGVEDFELGPPWEGEVK